MGAFIFSCCSFYFCDGFLFAFQETIPLLSGCDCLKVQQKSDNLMFQMTVKVSHKVLCVLASTLVCLYLCQIHLKVTIMLFFWGGANKES